MKEHQYVLKLTWTGNQGKGTSSYRAYSRDHEISADGKVIIAGSSDPAFRGDSSKYNPEELLLASLASCHMLWFLHLCSESGLVVTAYHDQPKGTMVETADGGGRFQEVCLYPVVTLIDANQGSMLEALHERAHELCFIANSVNFPVRCEAQLAS